MKKKWPQAGIIFCETEQVACAYCSTEDGTCKRERCNIHDADYIKRQAEIEKTRLHNDEERRKVKLTEKTDPPAPIRNDSTRAISQIEALEKRSRYCFMRGWTERGFEYAEKAVELKRAML